MEKMRHQVHQHCATKTATMFLSSHLKGKGSVKHVLSAVHKRTSCPAVVKVAAACEHNRGQCAGPRGQQVLGPGSALMERCVFPDERSSSRHHTASCHDAILLIINHSSLFPPAFSSPFAAEG